MSALSRVSDLLAELDASETWRPVEGWPGYEVSSWGKVKGPRCILAASLLAGYQIVSLSRCSSVQNVRVHRLVAAAFLGPAPFAGAIVAHNDGDRLNCRVSNLRWASARENQFDRIRHKTRCQGSRVAGAKLREDQIPAIRLRIANGEDYSAIADDFGVSKSTIYLIRHNRIWRSAGGAAWELKNVG